MARTNFHAHMRTFFLLFAVFASFCNGRGGIVTLTIDARNPQPTTTGEHRVPEAWKAPNYSTWFGVYQISELEQKLPKMFPSNVVINDRKILEFARELWYGLKAEYEYDVGLSAWHAHSGWCVIAVMWDPVHQNFFASTRPYGARQNDLKVYGQTRAPVWYSKISRIARTDSLPNFHAEDGVYYGWETHPGNHGAGGVFPGNMRIVTWASMIKLPDRTRIAVPGHQLPLCPERNGDPNLGCDSIAGALNVGEGVISPALLSRSLTSGDGNFTAMYDVEA